MVLPVKGFTNACILVLRVRVAEVRLQICRLLMPEFYAQSTCETAKLLRMQTRSIVHVMVFDDRVLGRLVGACPRILVGFSMRLLLNALCGSFQHVAADQRMPDFDCLCCDFSCVHHCVTVLQEAIVVTYNSKLMHEIHDYDFTPIRK